MADLDLSNISDDELLCMYREIHTECRHHALALFAVYNIRDVQVLVKLDEKLKFIPLINQMAHENTVPYSAILGTVRYVETGIMNRAHNVHNLICADKHNTQEKNEKVEGAVVFTPHPGLHKWVGSVDIASLYPSVIRALNLSIETFIGQFNEEEFAWKGITSEDDNLYTLRHNKEEIIKTGKEWKKYILENGYAISAFGTVFDQSKPGMVSDTLSFWFSERKRLQAKSKEFSKKADTLLHDLGTELSDEVLAKLK